MNPLARKIINNPIDCYPQATVACFDPTCGDLPRRKLDEDRLVHYLEELAAAGAEAVLLAASTGHGHLRTVEELQRWFEVAAQANAPDLVRMALLRPEDGEEANAKLIEVLREYGYPVVFIRPGTNLPPFATDAQIVENMRPLVEQIAKAGMAVGVYSIPDVSGVPLPVSATEKLVDLPGGDAIVAAKITEADYLSSTREYLLSPRLARLKIVQGWDPHLAQALSEGPRSNIENKQRVGITSGPMSFAVYQYLYMLEAAQEHDWSELELSQKAVTALFEAMQDDPEKFADLQRAKFIMGLGLPFTASVETDQIERVLRALEHLPRKSDQRRLAKSLDLMGDGPYHDRLVKLYDAGRA
ncbi:hypothetical protein [Bremerella cremea]|uniref:hypothetical protein n=1 Tax=Bremerella cremea TaxID=1031537 RepID=UPI0031E9A60D